MKPMNWYATNSLSLMKDFDDNGRVFPSFISAGHFCLER
jgi:hypothetical protein